MVASIFLLVVTCFSPLALSSCGPPAVNAATVALIKQYEGFVASPSKSAVAMFDPIEADELSENDPSGYPTVGYGHKCEKKGCAEVTAKGYKFPLTQSTAASLLQADLKVRSLTAQKLNPLTDNGN